MVIFLWENTKSINTRPPAKEEISYKIQVSHKKWLVHKVSQQGVCVVTAMGGRGRVLIFTGVSCMQD